MKLKYSKYKNTGVDWIGNIPIHWDVTKVKYETLLVIDGTHFTPNYIDKGIPFLRVTDIQDKEIDFSSIKFISREEHDILSKRCNPQRGDLLLSKNGTIGITKIVDWDFECSLFVSICLIKFKETYLPHLFSYLFQSDIITQQVFESSKKSTVTNLHLDKIRELLVIKPTPIEQIEIVKYLDEKTTQIDNLISITEKKIETLTEKRTSLINTVVTKGLNPKVKFKGSGVDWIGDIPEHWTVSRIGFVSTLFTGFPWKSELFDYNEGIKIVRGENVSEGFLRWGERTRYWKSKVEEDSIYYLKKGDIIISMDGSKVGKNFVLITENDLPLLLHQRMCRVRVNQDISESFICYFIGSEKFKYYIDITKTDPMIPHITQKDIFNFKFSLPPIQEQNQIVKYLDFQTKEIDKLVSIEQKRIEVLKEYRQSLISEVVTGKVRVCEEDPNKTKSKPVLI